MEVLVVEDERDIRELLVHHLSREGLDVSACGMGTAARDFLLAQKFDLIILDWMLPEISGLELLKFLRTTGPNQLQPVLMLTARTQESDIVLALEMGADDYMTKPFSIPVVLARARALLRRASRNPFARPEIVRVRDLLINLDTREVRLKKERLELTPSEYKLLVALAENSGRALTRKRLRDIVREDGADVTLRTIDTHMVGLRKKLGAAPDIIETIRSVGYRIS